ncbi:MAG: hypothetical protein FJ265_09890 [Planctomycetes bacterium]|nr:hypothetical protein [Planctomycetota bacterium]
MLKTALLVLATSMLSASAVVYVGRTVHSSPFQMDIPYGSAIRTTVDPANIWSWHHTFGNSETTADVLVDVDGNQVMDTEHAWLRVLVTDIELVTPQFATAFTAWIRDSTGRRFAVATAYQGTSHAVHAALATPIALPVNSALTVELQQAWAGTEVHLIGRVVNL